MTYLNERSKKHVEPLAQALEVSIFMPMDVMVEGQTEEVFERIEKEWGAARFPAALYRFSSKETLHGCVVDVDRDGFLKTIEVEWPTWRAIDEEWRHDVHHDLLRQPDGGGSRGEEP